MPGDWCYAPCLHMWQLVINGPGYFDTPYDLPEGLTTIGRADENDIVLSGDLVSRRHVRLYVNGGELILEDLASRNGSKLNHKPFVGKVAIQPGDVLSIGENALTIRQPQLSERAPTELLLQLTERGVRRLGSDPNLGSALLVSKDVRESAVLRALDNVGRWKPVDFAPFGPEPVSERKVGYEALLLLYRVSEKLGKAPNLTAFLEETVDRLLAQTNATYGVVLLRQPSGAMAPHLVRHRFEQKAPDVPVSEGIVASALEKGAALVVADVHDEPQLASDLKGLGASQVVCVPLGQTAPFGGLLYLSLADRPSDAEALVDLVTAVAHLVAAGVERFLGRDSGAEGRRLREALERFHGREVAERRAVELSQRGEGRTALESLTGTLLMVELTGFGQPPPPLLPEVVGAMLTEFHRRVSEVTFSFQGTVHGFWGPSAMALFGAPYSKPDDALRAVRAAMVLQSDWHKAMANRPAQERWALRLALHTGGMLAGTVGWEGRLDFAAVGPCLEVVRGLCESAHPGQVLISGQTVAELGGRFELVPLGERALQGAPGATSVYEVVREDLGQGTHPGTPS